MKQTIEFPTGNRYRPEAVTVDGVEYSAALFAQEYPILHERKWQGFVFWAKVFILQL